MLKSFNSASHVETRANAAQRLNLVNAPSIRRRRFLARGGVPTIEAPFFWRARVGFFGWASALLVIDGAEYARPTISAG
jgi:hypothetical protein